MKYCERIYSEAEIKLIKEIFDMNIKQLYDDNLKELVLQCKEMFLEHQKSLKEIERLNNIINECAEDILKELEENHHLSYGVALGIRQKLLDYKELKGSDKK